MKVIHLSTKDSGGGAAIAAYRIHQCLINHEIESEMWVNRTFRNDDNIIEPKSTFKKAISIARPHLIKPFIRLMKTENKSLHSVSILPSNWVHKINKSTADIIHLHFIQGEMLSIADINRIKKPIIWTLHDMWAFCGAEHYTPHLRWKEGYNKSNRPESESGPDLNRLTWLMKRKLWNSPFQIVAPSNWLSDCVKSSLVLKGWPVATIKYPINTKIWSPINQKIAKKIFNFSIHNKIILFGAIGGTLDARKGFDLLQKALKKLKTMYGNLDYEIVIFGQNPPKSPIDLEFPAHYIGHLHDSLSLRMLYSAADIMLIPSRQDNLPNTGIEAQSCGTPVVAFNIGGMPDIISHKVTGYLAQPFNTSDFAAGLMWILNHKNPTKIRENSRNRALRLFSENIIAKEYMNLYNETLNYFNK